MMRNLLLVLKNSKFRFFILSLIINSLLIFNICFATNVIGFKAEGSVGPKVLKYNHMTITGDSFAARFCKYEMGKDIEMTPYAIAGHTVTDNLSMMVEAINMIPKLVFISIGVNDQYQETMPYNFEANMRYLLNTALSQNKLVFFHSFLKYFSPAYDNARFSASYYDNILKRVSSEYENAYYIDVHDLENEIFIDEDSIHYNKAFYDVLYDRLYNLLYEIDFAG